ncbi:hypothetical protein IV203_010886 [Nitzschia inconspicua]|uniref:Uncharacterized protein n=1 Tax=Nitzschia inconspicua TaxID=303405 RepID=A0A9K3KYN1_9STRA|nr:hypothetical protein IV203_010886 [Nitzschia inconspicua]
MAGNAHDHEHNQPIPYNIGTTGTLEYGSVGEENLISLSPKSTTTTSQPKNPNFFFRRSSAQVFLVSHEEGQHNIIIICMSLWDRLLLQDEG